MGIVALVAGLTAFINKSSTAQKILKNLLSIMSSLLKVAFALGRAFFKFSMLGQIFRGLKAAIEPVAALLEKMGITTQSIGGFISKVTGGVAGFLESATGGLSAPQLATAGVSGGDSNINSQIEIVAPPGVVKSTKTKSRLTQKMT